MNNHIRQVRIEQEISNLSGLRREAELDILTRVEKFVAERKALATARAPDPVVPAKAAPAAPKAPGEGSAKAD